MKLSIVSTLFLSEDTLRDFYHRTTEVAQNYANDDYEIILVNDGSPDNSLEIAIELVEEDDRLRVIDLSRNFGHYKAIMTGLNYAQGDRIFLVDSDLEEEPEYLNLFSKKMDQNNCDVVFGVQDKRKGKLFERISGRVFWYIFNLLSGIALPANTITARLMKRDYVNALLLHQEKEIFIAGLWYITGFDQQECLVTKKSTSKSSYTFPMKLSLLVNSITSFSNTPLKLIFYLGITILFFSCIYITYLSLMWAYFLEPPSGWTSVMASIWLLGGLLISLIGVIGIYLSKIFLETKNRPYTIIRREYGMNSSKRNC